MAATTTSPPREAAAPERSVPPDGPPILAGFLSTFEGDPNGVFWPLRQGVLLVGRKDSAEGLAIPIDHPTTSSRHAQIHVWARPGRAKVEDLGSTNGTYVNDQRVEPHQPRDLSAGDSLRFGGYAVTVQFL